MTQITKEAIESASIVTAIEQTITLIERGSINAKLISALLAECKAALSNLPIAVEGKVEEQVQQEECDYHRAAEADFQNHVNYLKRAREWE